MATMNSDIIWVWGSPIRIFNNIRWEDLTGIYSLHLADPGITLGAIYLVKDVARRCAIAREHVYNTEGRHE